MLTWPRWYGLPQKKYKIALLTNKTGTIRGQASRHTLCVQGSLTPYIIQDRLTEHRILWIRR